jgi:flagellar biosynthetic protein FliQ
MDSAEVVQIGKDSIFLLLKISVPIMLVALVVGLIISLFQALTQIQESTISFVPKIIAVFLVLIMMLPYMIESMQTFMTEIERKITEIGTKE